MKMDMTQFSPLTLRDLLQTLQGAQLCESVKNLPSKLAVAVDLVVDSRQVTAGSWFLAYRGEQIDSHRFLTPELLAQLAGVLYEDPHLTSQLQAQGIPCIQVKDGRLAWAYAAAARYGHPENHLRLIGVTGTNGKTSTVWLIRELLSLVGIPCLSLGTLGAFFPDETVEIGHTTPDPEQLFRLLADAKSRGIFHVVMEVSSHAIAQQRLGPLKFDASAFTSFSRDHLDFHETMAQYFAQKWQFISNFQRSNSVVAIASHILDSLKSYGHDQQCPESVVIYGSKTNLAQLSPHQKQMTYRFLDRGLAAASIEVNDGQDLRVGSVKFVTEHGVENFLAALLLVEKISGQKVDSAIWEKVQAVPGRLEALPRQGDYEPIVFVDYAHTPDAIERTLQTLRSLVKGRLWIVFGCGGGRDPGKRPLMAKAAAAIADGIVVTSDNPRLENPAKIVQDIITGLGNRPAEYVDLDRRQAINWVVQQAAASDVILIAGKGHETYQLIGGLIEPFDDRLVAQDALQLRRQNAADRVE